MRTKNSIFGYAAVFVTAALALAGCQRDLPSAETATPDYDNLKFVVTVSEKSGNAAYTRALKDGWIDGDRIVAFFNNDKTKYVVLTYDESTAKWTGDRSSVADIALTGSMQALHAGSATFDFDGTEITGVTGDLLYAGAAGDTYSIDGDSNTAYLTLTMTRGLTSAIKMEGGPDKAANEKWRVAGDDLWVAGGTTTLAASSLGTTIDFGTALQELFIESDAQTQKAAAPDPAFTDNEIAVFHIWNKGEEANTVFYIYNEDAPTTVYTRTYAARLVAGETVLLAGPGSSDEKDDWKLPEISVTTHPADLVFSEEEGVTAGSKLTVAATVTMDAVLSYQWYENTSASNEGGTAIDGATDAEYTLPTTLEKGKKYYYFVEVGATGGAASVRSDVATITVGTQPSVTVAAQSGTILQGEGASATFAVTTERIGDGEYDATVANLPSGVTVSGKVTIAEGAGMLTLAGDATTTAGITSTLTLTLDGVTSAEFELVISQYITPAALSVAAPFVGQSKPNAPTGVGTGYTASLTWTGGVSGEGGFSYAKDYTAQVTLTAAKGYLFDPATVSGFTLNGQAHASTSLGSADSKLVFTIAPYNSGGILRTDWTVALTSSTSPIHNTDKNGDVTTGYPEHMFDDHLGSYLSVAKSGQSGQSSTPYFTVDMKASREFDYLVWGHRNGSYSIPGVNGSISGNSYSYLRAYGVKLEGSDNDETYTPIAPVTSAGDDDMIVWIPMKSPVYLANSTTQTTENQLYTIDVAKSTYRYIRVHILVHSRNYGSGTGKYQHPDYVGDGQASGGATQVSEFGVGLKAE